MSKDTKKTRTPRLRFPEFREAEGWEETQLSELGELVSGLTYSPDDVRENGLLVLRSSNIQNGEIVLDDCVCVTTNIKGANLSRPNDILICVRNGSKNLIGKNALIPEGLPLCTHGAFMTVFRSKSPKFVYQLFQTDAYNEQVSADLGATINSINGSHLIKYKFFVPQPNEQQKIAATLSSLDDLITAQNQKIEALEAHKKGLMQQLFPGEGETAPRLRFPEFRDGGEWEEKTLGQIGDILMCKRIFSEETNEHGGVAFFKIGTLGGKPDAFISKKLFDEYKAKYNFPRKGEILITCSGTVGKCLIYNGEDAYYQDSNIVWIDNPTLEISNDLMYYLISKVNWGKLNSTTITRIYGSDLRNLPMIFPKDQEEQQKIAACLSSIDDLIKAQTQKLEALKAHKKGLMQQLFPNPNDNKT